MARAEAQHCDELLTYLTTGATDTSSGPMNPNNLRDAKGLLFLDFSKTGLVVGVESIKGFLITLKPDGSWSAPVFVSGSGFSLGLTAGHQNARTLVALYTDKAIEAARKPFKMGIDFKLTIATVDFEAGVDISKITTDSAVFSQAKGGLVDLSLSGATVTPDDKLNEEAYGAGTTPDSILGDAKPPAEFEPVYARIKAVVAKAGVPGQVFPAAPYGPGDFSRAL